MSRYEFKLPDIGEGVVEGEIVAWAEGIAVGAAVGPEQPLAEVMTDKATVVIPSPAAGVIVELGGKVGDVIAVGQVLAVIETEPGATVAQPEPAERAKPAPAAEPAPAPTNEVPAPPSPVTTPAKPPVAKQADGPTATAAGSIPEELPGTAAASALPVTPAKTDKPLAAPATRRLARELGVELSQVPPTGEYGRVTADDVKSFASKGAATQVSRAPATQPAAVSIEASEREERIPLRGVRKRIFEQMARSMRTAAHFTFVEECDVTALSAMRSRLAPVAEQADAKLSFLPFIIKACVAALKKHPTLNAAFDESTQEIVVRKHYDIGIAAATDAGLMVPVVRGVDGKSLLEIARDVQRLSDDAKAGTIRREDLVGSTFTITSLGKLGGLFATPILNFPEVAILGVHQIKERPVVRDGQIVIGQVMLLSLSFDHRIIDGHVGAAFAYEVIGYLENPDRLMLEMR